MKARRVNLSRRRICRLTLKRETVYLAVCDWLDAGRNPYAIPYSVNITAKKIKKEDDDETWWEKVEGRFGTLEQLRDWRRLQADKEELPMLALQFSSFAQKKKKPN